MLDKIKKMMFEFADIYDNAWETGNFKHPIASMIRNDIVDDFKKIEYITPDRYSVKASCGTGRFTSVPWIAVFDKRITTKATEGVYIVYLLNKDTKELFLTLNQAATGSTLTQLKNNTTEIQEKLGIVFSESIFCGSNAYDAGCIFSKKYTIDDLNDKTSFLNDLHEFVKLYNKYYELVFKNSSTENSLEESFKLWIKWQPQRKSSNSTYSKGTIDAMVSILKRGSAAFDISDNSVANCFNITKVEDFEAFSQKQFDKAEQLDKKYGHSDYRNSLYFYSKFLTVQSVKGVDYNKIKDIVDSYEKNFDVIFKGEEYKIKALEQFNKHWNIDAADFAIMLEQSFSKCKNLLTAGSYYAYDGIVEFAKAKPEVVRALFNELYSETEDFVACASHFKSQSAEYFESFGKTTYQDLHAVSVYAFFKFPHKYCIYKSSFYDDFAELIGFTPQKTDDYNISRIKNNETLIEAIKYILSTHSKSLLDKFEVKEQECALESISLNYWAFDVIHSIRYKHKDFNNSKTGKFDSWEIIDEVTAIKHCDKSFFDYNGSGVPKGICWFFDAENLNSGESKQIKLVHNGQEYVAKIVNDTTDRRRIQILWKTDLGKQFDLYKSKDTMVTFIKTDDDTYEVIIKGGEKEMTTKEKIAAIKNYIAVKGFNYEGNLIENFYLSLKSKPFVILAGISGTGKTRLVKLFAEAIGAEMKLVPVRPDWSDSSDLFGHTDLNNNFHPGAILEFIKKAEWNKDKPFFLCLDEMNLARVEYYLSDFLSIIETRDRKDNGDIETDALINIDYYKNKEAQGKYGRVFIPENLYIIGTVNMDETTFPFSKKVLDRANTIEFSFVNLIAKPAEIFVDKPHLLSESNSFLKTEYLYLSDCDDVKLIDSICFDLEELNSILVKANLHVGYRVRDEISFYMMNNKNADLLDVNAAFDNEIMQKILPRVQGSSHAIKDVLSEMFIKCAGDYTGLAGATDFEQMHTYIDSAKDCKYPNSAKKIAFMMRRYEEDGFTSYWL